MRAARWIWKALLILAVVLLALLLVAAWLAGRESTLQYAVEQLVGKTNGEITVLGTRGGLYEGVAFDRVQVRGKNQLITLEQGVVRWDPGAWLTGTLLVTHAEIKKITIEVTGSSNEPMVEPASLELPVDVVASQVKVGVIDIRQGERITRLTEVDGALRYGRRQWDLQKLSLHTPWGAVNAKLRLEAKRPFAVEGDIGVQQDKGNLAYRTSTKLEGALAELRSNTGVALKSKNGNVNGRVAALLAPFKPQPLVSAQIDVPAFSPRAWNADWPEGKLSINALLAPATAGEDGTFTGQIKISNEMPGLIDQQRVPVKTLSAAFTGDINRVALSDISIDLGAGGQFAGGGEWVGGATNKSRLALQTKNLNLSGVHGKLKPTAIRGDIALAPNGDAWQVTAKLAEQKLGVQLDANITKELVDLKSAQLSAGKGVLDVRGQMKLTGQRTFNLAGKLRQFNPADFGSYPAADLNADLKLDGLADEAWQVRTDLTLAASRFMNRPLSGKAVVAASAQSVRDVDIALAVGANRLTARGGFALKGLGASNAQKLVWSLDAPRLAELSNDLSGNLVGNGEAVGSLDAATLSATLEGRDLRALGEHRVKLLNGRARVELKSGANVDDALIDAELSLQDYVSSKISLTRANAKIEGQRSAHKLKLAAANADLDLNAAASGAWENGKLWRGRVTDLSNRGRIPFALKAPVSLIAALPGRIEMDAAVVEVSGGQLNVENFRLVDGNIATRGNARGLPLALAVSFSEPLKRNLESTLRLGAEWNIATDVKRGSNAGADGSLRVFRESGDLVFLIDSRLPAGIEQLELKAQMTEGEVSASFNARGRQIGSIQVDTRTRTERRDGIWGIPASAPLQLKGEIDVPSLVWASRLASEPGLTVDGALRASIIGDGSFGTPRLRGQATGRALKLRWADQGLNYRDGEFDAEFTGDSLDVKRLVMLAGEGRMEAQGNVSISGVKTSGKLTAKLDRFEAVSRPDRLVVASGEGALQLDDNRLTVSGKLRADRGFFELPEKSDVVLSDDVTIIGKAGAKEATRMKTRVDLNLDLGEQFKVRGAGLNGKLAGAMRVVSADAGLPRAVGTLRIEEGTYTVYGQKLTVERGLLSFAGPIHNPGINLLAVRKTAQAGVGVEAGVEVSGSANAPKAKLVSTPNVSETEKLSWLVLGRGLESSSKADFSLLSAAASGLLGSSQGASLQSKIANTLGVDEIGITPAAAGQDSFLSVGKRISSKLYATYEQGLGKVSNIIKIRYVISPRWSLQAQAGTESAADVLYTIAFD
ncbi:MAG: translocation/assembly module TamB domain-containing protein [Betaproteobacteria bacterium]|nr:translocation/assembly module TamB domain-containing protein [Betaproteobacteria bacterium]